MTTFSKRASPSLPSSKTCGRKRVSTKKSRRVRDRPEWADGTYPSQDVKNNRSTPTLKSCRGSLIRRIFKDGTEKYAVFLVCGVELFQAFPFGDDSMCFDHKAKTGFSSAKESVNVYGRLDLTLGQHQEA